MNGQLEVRVTRINARRMLVAQALVPIAILLTISARRIQAPTLIALAVLLQAGVLLAFISAAKRLGWLALRVERGSVGFTFRGEFLVADRIRRWSHQGDSVRLYAADETFRVRTRRGEGNELAAQLRAVFGPPIELAARGPKRWRWLAMCAAAVGLVLTVVALILSRVGIVVVGVPLFVLGVATFGALSQRIPKG